MMAAVGCIVIAAGLLVFANYDAAFVAAVLGMVSWFLNYRAQASSQLAERDPRRFDDQEGDDDEN